MDIQFKKRSLSSCSSVSSVIDSIEVEEPPEITKNQFLISSFMDKINKIQKDVPKYSVIEKCVKFHDELIHKMIDENKSLKELVHITLAQTNQRIDQISIEMENSVDNSFKRLFEYTITKEYLNERLSGTAKEAEIIELYREFRILKDYTKHIETVLFQGYKAEAEIVLKDKIGKEAFANLQLELQNSHKSMENKCDGLLKKIKYLNDEIFILKSTQKIEEVKKENEYEIRTKSKQNSLVSAEVEELVSEKTAEFDELAEEKIDFIPISQLSGKVVKPMFKQMKLLQEKSK